MGNSHLTKTRQECPEGNIKRAAKHVENRKLSVIPSKRQLDQGSQAVESGKNQRIDHHS